MIEKKVAAAVSDYGMLQSCNCIIAGLSGGADSTALVDVLHKNYNIKIVACHINHGIRGTAADNDQKFSEEFCKKRNIEFVSFKIDVPSLAKEKGISEEECGRQERYRLFSLCAEKYENAKIATAHTLSDNAETVLFNLTRGTGLRGMCGIPAVRDNIIRPLIYCTRSEIEAYCAENGINFVTDETNFLNEYTRNKIRNTVIPVLKDINLNFEESVGNFARLVLEDEKYLSEKAEEIYRSAVAEGGLKISILAENDRCIVKRIIRMISPVSLSSDKTEKIYSLIKNGSTGDKVLIKGNIYAYLSYGILKIDTLPQEFDVIPETLLCFGENVLKSGKRIEIKVNNFSTKNLIDCDKISKSQIIVRSRKVGDKIKLGGHTKTLKKLFIDLKIPSEIRNSLAVVCCGEDIVYVEKIGVSDLYKAAKNCSNIAEIVVVEE